MQSVYFKMYVPTYKLSFTAAIPSAHPMAWRFTVPVIQNPPGLPEARGYQCDPLAGRGRPAELSCPAAPRNPHQLPPGASAAPGHPFRAHCLQDGGFTGGRVKEGFVLFLSGPFKLHLYSICSFSCPRRSWGRAVRTLSPSGGRGQWRRAGPCPRPGVPPLCKAFM